MHKFKNDSDHNRASNNPLDVLELPSHITKSMWEKAQDLSTDERFIVNAPGDQKAFMVKSYSNKQPHYVKRSLAFLYVMISVYLTNQ